MADEKKEEGKETFYHYTDEKGAKGIAESGVINQSTGVGDDDVAFGKGAYLTQVPPSESKCDIAANNYDNRTNEAIVEDIVNEGRVDYYVEVKLPESAVEKCETPDGRDVYRVPDSDLKITPDMEAEIGKTSG